MRIGDEVEVQRATPKNAPWGVYHLTGSGSTGPGGTGNGWTVIVDFAQSDLAAEANVVHGNAADGTAFALPGFNVVVVDGGATQQTATAACNTADAELAAAHIPPYGTCLFWTPEKKLQNEDGTPADAAATTTAPTTSLAPSA